MSLTVNAKNYTANKFYPSSVVYAGPAKTLSKRDDLVLSMQEAIPTSTSSGVSRYGVKLVRTATLTGAKETQRDIGVDIQFRVPVGAADADVNASAEDVGQLLASDAFQALLRTLVVNG